MAVAVLRFNPGDLQAVAMAVKGDKFSPRWPPLMEKRSLCVQGRPRACTLTHTHNHARGLRCISLICECEWDWIFIGIIMSFYYNCFSGKVAFGLHRWKVLMRLGRWIRFRRSDGNSGGWSGCPVFSVLLYQLHCLSWPDEYLIGICRFICMLYNFGLCNANTGREAAAPTLPRTRTPSSAGGSLKCCSKEQREGLIQGAGKAFSHEAFPLFLTPLLATLPCREVSLICSTQASSQKHCNQIEESCQSHWKLVNTVAI